MISVIIPALNEEKTIEDVIAVAKLLPSVSEIIVVSDGSTDHTAEVARNAGAIVIDQPNTGKAEAMQAGVTRASQDILMFLDADLRGLTLGMLEDLSNPVLEGKQDMTIIARDYWFDYMQYLFPRGAIGGERVLRRAVWDAVPQHERKGFQIELALNYHTRRKGMRYSVIWAKGLHHVLKMQKRGWLKGGIAEVGMVLSCSQAFVSYYCMPSFLRRKR
jgi:polyisoprenyl-phosphate glycosyltransferase